MRTGHAKGLEEGYAKALEERLAKARTAILNRVKKLKDRGESATSIQEITGLTLSEIECL